MRLFLQLTALVLLAGCRQAAPCETVDAGQPAMMLLVYAVEPMDDGASRVSAIVFNAPPQSELASERRAQLQEKFTETTPLGRPSQGQPVEFVVEGDNRVFVQGPSGPLMPPTEQSNAFVVENGKWRVEPTTTPDFFSLFWTQGGFFTFWVPSSTPSQVRLIDGRGQPLPADSFECTTGPAPMADFVTSCDVWIFDPADGRGFHGSRVQALVTTPAAVVRTRIQNIR